MACALWPLRADAQDAWWATYDEYLDAIANLPPEPEEPDLTPAHLDSALAYVGTRELGNNAGPEIERFLATVGLGAGNPYCAAFVSTMLEAPTCPAVKLPTVRSGLARAFKVRGHVKASMVLRGEPIPPGTILGWEKGNTTFGHLGIVVKWDGQCGQTVEANTSSGTYGSQRDGDGVWIRERCIEPGNYFRITWFTLVEYEDQ